MPTMTRHAVASVAALAVTLGAAACSKGGSVDTAGIAARTATNSATSTATSTSGATGIAAGILGKAKSNALSATSGAFRGAVQQSSGKMQIDFKGTSDGKSADVSLAVAGKGRVRLIAVGGGVYLQGDETYWKSQKAPASVQQAGDKFVKVPPSASNPASRLNLTAFLQQAFAAVTPDKLSDQVASATVNGVDCWVLTDKKGAANGALYVSKAGNELVRFTGSSASPGQLDFSRWNEDLGIAAPPASQVLALP